MGWPLPEALDGVAVQDGRPLRDLLARGPVLLLFLRHLG